MKDSKRLHSGLPLFALFSIALIACDDARDERKPEPGMELYAVAPETVREVIISSPGYKLYAYRWTPDDAFHVLIATRGRSEVEQCTAGEGFSRWLVAASRMPIAKKLDRRVDSASEEWADLQLRDSSQLDPLDLRLHIPSAPGEPAVIQFGTDQYTVDVDVPMLRSARSGCATLGAKP